MAWDLGQLSRRGFQSANIGGRDVWLIPKVDTVEGFPLHGQSRLSELLRFDHPDLRRYPEYKYQPLAQDKKRIRLMKLYPGEASGIEIHCELMEAEYDPNFHIPTRPQRNHTSKSTDGNEKNKRSGGDNEEDEGERSDMETRCQAKTETDEERLARKKRERKRQLLRAVAELKKDPDQEKVQDEEKHQKRIQEWRKVKERELQYEALSWCWGQDKENYAVLIHEKGMTYKKRVRKDVALAMKYLRRPGKQRILWIDAVCIDQANPNERNHQVQMMSRVYSRAQQVCIWLGEADADSETAINFIKNDMKELKNFDIISSNEQYSRKWQALMSLMQRDWFFRRWVVQELALSSAATVYCGPHSVPWKSFAVAVELFVEVETATHRLSEVMKKDEKFRHVPGWFEYVSELGASLLVQATGKVFRTKRSPMELDPSNSDDETEEGMKHEEIAELEKRKVEKKEAEDRIIEQRLRETQTIDPLERRSLLSLEYLVSTMFIFQASEPRDAVYALLAIARDASPFAPAHYGQDDQKLFLVMTLLDQFLAEKPFTVDYNRPYSDVSRDYVEFSIARTSKTDPHQALDVLCRPWALDSPKGRSKWLSSTADKSEKSKRRMIPKRKNWKKRDMKILTNSDGYWVEGGRRFKMKYADNQNSAWELDPQENKAYRLKAENVLNDACKTSDCKHTEKPCPVLWWNTFKNRYFPMDENSAQKKDDVNLPSWVARVSQAPFMLDHTPGMEMRKTSRANADPLVGSPLDGHRNYNAAGSEALDFTTLKFRKRPVLGHYSLYVKGFVLDEVVDVEDASQLGSIPRSWLELGRWTDLKQDPPDEFWRTIVADRGRENRNPPYYYARACKESVHKGSHLGGSVNTTALINDEQNSIIAEFCRRVHAVIWNRCLFRTKDKRLGVGSKVKVGDKVCILYGCTVPVILREVVKDKGQFSKDHIGDLEREAEEDRVETLKACIRRAISNRERKGKYKEKKREYEDNVLEEMLDARMAYLEEKTTEKQRLKEESNRRSEDARTKEVLKTDQTKLAARVHEAEKEMEDAQKQINAAELARNAPGDEGAVQIANDQLSTAKATYNTAKEKKDKVEKEMEDDEKQAGGGLDGQDQASDQDENPAMEEGHTEQNPTNGAPQVEEPLCNNFWYEFMGECYLHGMMDGEAMREKFYRDLKDWVFELR